MSFSKKFKYIKKRWTWKYNPKRTLVWHKRSLNMITEMYVRGFFEFLAAFGIVLEYIILNPLFYLYMLTIDLFLGGFIRIQRTNVNTTMTKEEYVSVESLKEK